MKVSNMTSAKGNKIPNQFIIEDGDIEYFQSYETIIAKKEYGYFNEKTGRYEIKVTLDSRAWDYSVTTGKYRNMFLNETKKETEAKIKSGEYQLADLNQ